MMIHSYFISHRGSDDAFDLYRRLSGRPHPSCQRIPVWLDKLCWSGQRGLREEIANALHYSEWCVGCCTDDLLGSEWCRIECTAAAEANRLLLYRPERLLQIPVAWKGAGELKHDLSIVPPKDMRQRQVKRFIGKASASAQIYLLHRTVMLIKEHGRDVNSSLLEIVLRNTKPLVDKARLVLSSTDSKLIVELCREIAGMWDLRPKKSFEVDFCEYLAPVLLSLIGTPHENLAICAFNDIVNLMKGDKKQFDRVLEWVQQGIDIEQAIFWRDEIGRFPPVPLF